MRKSSMLLLGKFNCPPQKACTMLKTEPELWDDRMARNGWNCQQKKLTWNTSYFQVIKHCNRRSPNKKEEVLLRNGKNHLWTVDASWVFQPRSYDSRCHCGFHPAPCSVCECFAGVRTSAWHLKRAIPPGFYMLHDILCMGWYMLILCWHALIVCWYVLIICWYVTLDFETWQTRGNGHDFQHKRYVRY